MDINQAIKSTANLSRKSSRQKSSYRNPFNKLKRQTNKTKAPASVFAKSTQTTLLALLSSSFAYADIDYSLLSAPINVIATVDVDDTQQLTESFSFTSEAAFADALNNNLFNDASIYQLAGPDPYASATFNIDGGTVTLTSNQGSGEIQMYSSVPLFNQTFTGASRDESSQLAKQWLDANVPLVTPTPTPTPIPNNSSPASESSTTNPIYGAGPSSPVSFIPSSDSQIDNNGGLSSQFLNRGTGDKGGDKDSSLGVATRFSNFCTNQKCAQFYSIPISFTKELGNEWALLFKVPLTYINTANVSSYSIAVSTGLRIPISRYINTGPFKWDLIPLFNIGGVGTDQAGVDSSLLYAGGIQSNFGINIGAGYSVVMQNQYSHFITSSVGPFLQNGQRISFDVVNDIYRNGIQLGKEFTYQLFGRTVMASIFFADTRFRGDALAINNQQEIGFDIGLKAHRKAAPIDFSFGDLASADKIKKKIKSEVAGNDIKLGITYMNARNIDSAISANLGWTF